MCGLQGSPAPDAWHDLTGLGKPQGITVEIASKLGRHLFGISVHTCKELPSERDRNFLLTTTSSTKGQLTPKYVLKLCNLTEDPEVVDMQASAPSYNQSFLLLLPNHASALHVHSNELASRDRLYSVPSTPLWFLRADLCAGTPR